MGGIGKSGAVLFFYGGQNGDVIYCIGFPWRLWCRLLLLPVSVLRRHDL